jgi:hypothetical protein
MVRNDKEGVVEDGQADSSEYSLEYTPDLINNPENKIRMKFDFPDKLILEDERWTSAETEEGEIQSVSVTSDLINTPIEPYKKVCDITNEELAGEVSPLRAVEIGTCIKENFDEKVPSLRYRRSATVTK